MRSEKMTLDDFIMLWNEKCNEKLKSMSRKRCLGAMGIVKGTNMVKCRRKTCRKYDVFIKCNLFVNKKLSDETVLKIIYLWCCETKTKSICNISGVSRQAVYRVLKKFYNILDELKEFYILKLGGEDIIVEIDESKFGKRKYNRGHKVDGVWIVGLVEKTEQRKIILLPVRKRNANTLIQICLNNVYLKSVVQTDCWKGYNNLSQFGFVHKTVNHSLYFKDPLTQVHTNTIEGNWSALKKTVPYRCRTILKIQPYLNLVMFKRNCKCNMFKLIIEKMIE